MEIEVKVSKQISVTRSVYLSEDQLEELLREFCKMPNGTVTWHDSSYGGINGVTIAQQNTEYEDDSE